MSKEAMIVQLPMDNGGMDKKAVIQSFLSSEAKAGLIYRTLPFTYLEPWFVSYENLSEQDKKLWDEFMSMIGRNQQNYLPSKNIK